MVLTSFNRVFETDGPFRLRINNLVRPCIEPSNLRLLAVGEHGKISCINFVDAVGLLKQPRSDLSKSCPISMYFEYYGGGTVKSTLSFCLLTSAKLATSTASRPNQVRK